MRLTLRTLLAYLDGILPPAAHDDLAGQVAGTPVAENLVRRIRRVVSRPEIPAPQTVGRGLAADATTVAEFLDNTLSPDRLPAFEKICLESDMHLAEVASCHALLAELARDPAAMPALDAAVRERLGHEILHRLATEAVHAERDEARENAAAIRSAIGLPAAPAVVASDAGPVAARRERERGRKPWLAWGSAVLAAAVLVLAGGMLMWSVASSGRAVAARRAAEMPVADRAGGVDPPAAPAVAEPPAAPPDLGGEAAAVPADKPALADKRALDGGGPPMEDRRLDGPMPDAAAEDGPTTPPPMEDRRLDGPMPDAAAEDGPTTPPPLAMKPDEAAPPPSLAAGPRVPAGDALAIAAPRSPLPEAGSAVPSPAPRPEKRIGGVGSGGVLLHNVLRAGRETWLHFPAGSELAEREKLIAPPGCLPEIDAAGVVVTLLPGTRADFSLDADGTPRITVVFGRIMARATSREATLGITAARLHGVVTAGLTETIAAVVELERQPGDDPVGQRAHVRSAIMSTVAPLTWRQLATAEQGGAEAVPLAGIPSEGMLEPRSTLTWDSDRPDVAATASRTASGWPDSPLRTDGLERGAASALAAALDERRPLFDTLLDMAAGSRAEDRSMAAATLSLLGQYDELVALLSADVPGRRLENSRWLAFEAATVPLALARGANSAAALRKAFAERGPRGKAEWLLAMARGFSDADLAAGADAALVEALDDPDLVVRRYAAKNLAEIVQPAAVDRMRYRADGLEDMRRDGAAWWRVQLQKGLVRRQATP